MEGGEGYGGGYFRHHLSLLLHLRTEVSAGRHVDKEHHGHLPLFLEHLDEWLVEASRHVPVDVTDVIAVLVFAHLGEGHTATLEGRVVLSGEDVPRKAFGLDLDLTDLLYYFVSVLHLSLNSAVPSLITVPLPR